MANACTGLGAGDTGSARIRKEVEHIYGSARLADLVHCKVPVARLLGKKSRVLEVHGLDIERQLAVIYLPACGQAALVPRTAAGLRAAIACIAAIPALVGAGRIPYCLRVGTH